MGQLWTARLFESAVMLTQSQVDPTIRLQQCPSTIFEHPTRYRRFQRLLRRDVPRFELRHLPESHWSSLWWSLKLHRPEQPQHRRTPGRLLLQIDLLDL